MKTKISKHTVFTAMFLLAFCQIFLLAGCAEQTKAPTETGLKVEKSGEIVSTIVESFEKEYYSQASLQEMIEDEITSYQKNGAITLNKVEVQETENGNTVTVEITYASGQDYAAFNDTKLFFGTVSEAQAAGYAIPTDLVSVKEDRTITSEELDGMKEKYVFITNESLPVTLPEKVAFVTQDTEIISSNCIKAREEGAKLTYVIMK